VLLSHDDDGVTKLGLDLLWTTPGWARTGPGRHRSTAGVPAGSCPGCAGGRSQRSSRASWT
jgi:hypothetical protein